MPPYGFDANSGQWNSQQPAFGQNGYQMTYTPPTQVPTTQPQQISCYWVEGNAMPLTYRLRPGEQVFFMDITQPLIYMRQADKDGKPFPMETKMLVDPPAEQAQPQIDLSQYVKTSDIQGIINRAVEDEVNRRMSEISFKPATTPRKKGDEQ